MVNSQNGYPANNAALVSSRLVPGTTRKLTVRKGPAGDLLLWVASQFDKLVEDIEQGILDDWGYAERPIRGGTVLSNHASGTAIDLNATSHPLATDPPANFSNAKIGAIHSIIGRTNGCVRWGGDYTGRKDGMHFEIVASEARCASVLSQLNTQTDWIDMATKQEVQDATEEGFFKALYRYFSSDEVRFAGSNFADLVSQLRNSVVDLQTKDENRDEKIDQLLAKFDELIAAVEADKA
jgi:hypothetical protein